MAKRILEEKFKIDCVLKASEMRERGLTYQTIAKSFGVHASMLRKWIRKYDVKKVKPQGKPNPTKKVVVVERRNSKPINAKKSKVEEKKEPAIFQPSLAVEIMGKLNSMIKRQEVMLSNQKKMSERMDVIYVWMDANGYRGKK